MTVGFLCLRDSIRFHNENRPTLALVAAAATLHSVAKVGLKGVSLSGPRDFVQPGLIVCN